jgi:hypothetical protein
MRTLRLAIVAAMAVHSTARAQTRPTDAHRAFTSEAIHSVTPDIRAGAADRITRNASECAPDVADAVWDGNGNVLGYSCHSPSANGG